MKKFNKIMKSVALGAAALLSLGLISCNEKSGGKNGVVSGTENEPGWKLNAEKPIKILYEEKRIER